MNFSSWLFLWFGLPGRLLTQSADNGDPKIRNLDGPGNSGEIQGSCRISTETLGPGNSGKFILGTPFLAIWGDFLLLEMRMAKVDMLGRGE